MCRVTLNRVSRDNVSTLPRLTRGELGDSKVGKFLFQILEAHLGSDPTGNLIVNALECPRLRSFGAFSADANVRRWNCSPQDNIVVDLRIIFPGRHGSTKVITSSGPHH